MHNIITTDEMWQNDVTSIEVKLPLSNPHLIRMSKIILDNITHHLLYIQKNSWDAYCKGALTEDMLKVDLTELDKRIISTQE